jgi:hypothetical protein
MQTKGQLLRFCIWYALGNIKVQLGRRFYDLGLTPKMRDEVAIKAIAEMRKHHQWSELDEEAGPGPNWVGPTADH